MTEVIMTKTAFRSSLVFDIEIYPNFALVIFMTEAKKFKAFYTKDYFSEENKKEIAKIINQYTLIGYNSNNYDVPVLIGIMSGFDTGQLFRLSKSIISSGNPGWKTLQQFQLQKIKAMSHIDLMESSPGVRIGLKVYGARLHTKTLEDL